MNERITVLLGFGESLQYIPDFLTKYEPQFKHEIYIYSDSEINTAVLPKNCTVIDSFFNFLSSYRVIKSPGIPPQHPMVRRVRKVGAKVIGEFDLCLKHHAKKRILVSGSNGKTTVTALIAHLSKHLGEPFLAVGNIGTAVSKAMLEDLPSHFVLEASSYQLHDNEPFSYDVYILTSLSPDHIDWHGSVSAYYQAKAKPIHSFSGQFPIIAAKSSEKALNTVLAKNSACTWVEANEQAKLVCKEFPFLALSHNTLNVVLAIKALETCYNRTIDMHDPKLLAGLASFIPPKYRCETYFVNGQLVINDSKSTNVDSTIVCIEAVKGKVTLFVGGRAKLESFSRLSNYREKIERLIVFGESREKIVQDLNDWDQNKLCIFDSLHSFFETNNTSDLEGQIVFSPACASFDAFKNYLERGAYFDTQIKTKLK